MSYSYLSALSGSTFVARRAGTRHAINATNASSTAMNDTEQSRVRTNAERERQNCDGRERRMLHEHLHRKTQVPPERLHFSSHFGPRIYTD
jgi:hypothetical protein